MMRGKSIISVSLTLLIIVVLGLWLFPNKADSLLSETDTSSLVTVPEESAEPLSITPDVPVPKQSDKEGIMFVGDVMLAREVERLNQQFGHGYSFLTSQFLKDRSQHVVGNFEAAVPTTHVATPNFQFRFSVLPSLLGSLKTAGFSHLSLANNHSYDFGKAGYENTRLQTELHDLVAFGHPIELSSSSVVFLAVEDMTIAVIAIHTLYLEPAADKIANVLAYASASSDYQIAYIHWGDEYQLKHSASQRSLAKNLLAAGVDLIIGHHPHVVQDIERIGEGVVIYSLGNFVFDQYFSTDVQQGLAVYVYPEHGALYATLIPHTSLGTRAKPRLMDREEASIFLSQLASRSDPGLALEISAQKIFLATSSKIAIIEP